MQLRFIYYAISLALGAILGIFVHGIFFDASFQAVPDENLASLPPSPRANPTTEVSPGQSENNSKTSISSVYDDGLFETGAVASGVLSLPEDVVKNIKFNALEISLDSVSLSEGWRENLNISLNEQEQLERLLYELNRSFKIRDIDNLTMTEGDGDIVSFSIAPYGSKEDGRYDSFVNAIDNLLGNERSRVVLAVINRNIEDLTYDWGSLARIYQFRVKDSNKVSLKVIEGSSAKTYGSYKQAGFLHSHITDLARKNRNP